VDEKHIFTWQELMDSLNRALEWVFQAQITTGRETAWKLDTQGQRRWVASPVQPYQVGDLLAECNWGDGWAESTQEVHRHTSTIWHAGQVILALIRAYRITHQPEILHRARLTGDYLLRIQISEGSMCGLFYTVPYVQLDDPGKSIVRGEKLALSDMVESFLGLLELSACTGKVKYRQAVVACADWILTHGEIEPGFYGHDIDVSSGRANQGKANAWQCLLIDDACFYELYRATGDERYLEAFRRQIARRRTMSWPDEENRGNSRGTFWQSWPLIVAAQALRDPSLLDQAQHDYDGLLDIQLPDGALPQGEGGPCDCDGAGTAMAVLAWTQLYELTKEERYIEAASRALRFVLDNQYGPEGPDAMRGAYRFCHRVTMGEPKGPFSKGRTHYFGHRDIAVTFGISAICELLTNRPQSSQHLITL